MTTPFLFVIIMMLLIISNQNTRTCALLRRQNLHYTLCGICSNTYPNRQHTYRTGVNLMNYKSPAKTATLIGKERRWIIARCNEGKLPYIKENGRYLINMDKLQEALNQLETSFKPIDNKLKCPGTHSSKSFYKL